MNIGLEKKMVLVHLLTGVVLKGTIQQVLSDHFLLGDGMADPHPSYVPNTAVAHIVTDPVLVGS